MTELSFEEVTQLASLSGFAFSKEEVALYKEDISAILKQLAPLKELNTKGVEPTYQVGELHNIWRNDEVDQPLAGAELVSLAAEHAENSIIVPKVL